MLCCDLQPPSIFYTVFFLGSRRPLIVNSFLPKSQKLPPIPSTTVTHWHAWPFTKDSGGNLVNSTRIVCFIISSSKRVPLTAVLHNTQPHTCTTLAAREKWLIHNMFIIIYRIFIKYINVYSWVCVHEKLQYACKDQFTIFFPSRKMLYCFLCSDFRSSCKSVSDCGDAR